MITTYSPFDARYAVAPDGNLNGMVHISSSGYYGTGALLYGGRAVLTVAHLFDSPSQSAAIRFETAQGVKTIYSRSIMIHPDYDAVNSNHDLAIIWLTQAAPSDAQRYALYRQSDEVGKVFTTAGYGTIGTGQSGENDAIGQDYLALQAKNRFDIEIDTLKTYQGSMMAWQPAAGTQLVADFDNGLIANDALRVLTNAADLGEGSMEGLPAPGDSGGPALINGLLAGVATYTASLQDVINDPDIDAIANSSFGELAAWQRVSHYQQWIDQALRADYTNAPSTPEQVVFSVPEGEAGTTTLVYFLLQFNGQRSATDDWLSVDYATRDGSALAYEDYLPVSGTLSLYPGEDHAVIPVEVVGDSKPEGNERFFLDVFNPVGGTFNNGLITLTATRTILDDDLFS